MGCARARSRSPRATPRLAVRAAAVALALAATAGPRPARAVEELQPVSLDRILEAVTPYVKGARRVPEGIAFDVAGRTRFLLPFAAEELELVVEADAPILLIWTVQIGTVAGTPWGRPWRYHAIPRRATALRMDMRTVAGWTPAARPAIGLDGEGRVLVRAIRSRPVRNAAGWREDYDRARFWAPDSVGPTLINTVDPMYWSETGGTWLAEVVAALGLGAFALVLATLRMRTGRWRPGTALGAAALVAVALWNGYTLVRLGPMANLRPPPDPEERIRSNYYYFPEFGALAALARANVRPGDRVGAIAKPGAWFPPQTVCLDLAPRRCVILQPGQEVHRGISGVGSLRTSELDVIVSYRAGLPPPGFVPVATVGPGTWVARRP